MDDEDLRMAHRGHTAIYEQLRRHDPQGAAAAMGEHIRGTWMLRKPKPAGQGVDLADSRRCHLMFAAFSPFRIGPAA